MQEDSFSPFVDGSDITETDLDSLLPEYLVVTKLRKDAFGTVFKARNKKLQKAVNIRILPVPANEFPGGGETFLQYAAALPPFQHPHLAEISDYGVTEAGHLYLVTNAGEKDAKTVLVNDAETIRASFGSLLEILQWLNESVTNHGFINVENLTFDEYGNLKVDGFGLAGLTESMNQYYDPTQSSEFIAP